MVEGLALEVLLVDTVGNRTAAVGGTGHEVSGVVQTLAAVGALPPLT